MHILQLRDLREAIPKVMDSVLIDSTSPDQLHSSFSQAANGAAQAIKHFTQLVDDSKTKEVMEKARQSRMNNGEGITGWKVTEHQDWLNVRQEEGSDEADKEAEATAEAGDEISVKDVNAALDDFRSGHLGVETSLDEDSRTITVSLLHAYVRVMLKCVSSNYLCQPRSSSRFGSIPPPKATQLTALTARRSQNFTQRYLRPLERGLDRIIWIISLYV